MPAVTLTAAAGGRDAMALDRSRDRGQEDVAGLRQVAAHDHELGVEDVDHHR
jgi:hypothetical protein